jgi:hypothetical protein
MDISTTDAAIRVANTLTGIAEHVQVVSKSVLGLKASLPGDAGVIALSAAFTKLLESMVAHSGAVGAVIEENRIRRASCRTQ